MVITPCFYYISVHFLSDLGHPCASMIFYLLCAACFSNGFYHLAWCCYIFYQVWIPRNFVKYKQLNKATACLTTSFIADLYLYRDSELRNNISQYIIFISMLYYLT